MAEIHKALVAMQRDMDPIPKADRNKQQSYDYRSVVRVYDSMQPLLAKHGIFSTAEVVHQEHHERTERTQKGERTVTHAIVTMRYTYWTEDGSSVSSAAIGEGVDYGGDKASNKAQSIADKYALLQLFKVPFATVDPDRDLPPGDPGAPQTAPRNERVTAGDLQELTKLYQAKYPDNSADDFHADIRDLLGIPPDVEFNARRVSAWSKSDLDRVVKALGQPPYSN